MKFKFKKPVFRKKKVDKAIEKAKFSFKNLNFPKSLKELKKTNKKAFKIFTRKSEVNIFKSLKNLFKK